MQRLRSFLCILLIVCLLTASLVPVARADAGLDQTVQATAQALLDQYPTAGYGDEWVVFALQTAGVRLPNGYLTEYADSVSAALKEKNGVLSTTKVTDYVTVVLALTAAGYRADSFGGYDLTAPLQDRDFVRKQSVNGEIFALLALDYCASPFAGRDQYLQDILDRQLADGGWVLSGENGDVDVTAMALQALSRYTCRSSVRKAVQGGLDFLASKQNSDGGFNSYGTANVESAAQVLLALGELGIPATDSRFVRRGTTIFSALMNYQAASGGFSHIRDGQTSTMSTVQALLGLCQLRQSGRSVYGAWNWAETGSFSDLDGSLFHRAAEQLARQGIINGTAPGVFSPEGTLTRAMAVTLLWRMDGSKALTASYPFTDVTTENYYYHAVVWASENGIAQGTGEGRFSPAGTLTRQELTVLLYRFTQYRGQSTLASASLRACADGDAVAAWARTGMGWACALDLISGPVLGPEDQISRGETAGMLCRWMEVYAG